jgi:hypothetical protein
MAEGGPLALDLERTMIDVQYIDNGQRCSLSLQEFMKLADPDYLEMPRRMPPRNAATPVHPAHQAMRVNGGLRQG